MAAIGIYLFSVLFFALATLVGVYHLRKYRMPGDLSTVALIVYLIGAVIILAVTALLLVGA